VALLGALGAVLDGGAGWLGYCAAYIFVRTQPPSRNRHCHRRLARALRRRVGRGAAGAGGALDRGAPAAGCVAMCSRPAGLCRARPLRCPAVLLLHCGACGLPPSSAIPAAPPARHRPGLRGALQPLPAADAGQKGAWEVNQAARRARWRRSWCSLGATGWRSWCTGSWVAGWLGGPGLQCRAAFSSRDR
jgi:hypothetical protein